MKFLKDLIPYVIIFLTIVLLRTFLVTPVMVNGPSMNNTLEHNQIILLKKYDKTFTRNEIVVFKYNDSKLVKRVIGLPGETIKYEDGVLYINGEIVEDKYAGITDDFDLSYIGLDIIPEGYYFVLGDNRRNSSDSRIIGLVSKERIVGSTSFSLWPFKKIDK